jgi:hypothetical protein
MGIDAEELIGPFKPTISVSNAKQVRVYRLFGAFGLRESFADFPALFRWPQVIMIGKFDEDTIQSFFWHRRSGATVALYIRAPSGIGWDGQECYGDPFTALGQVVTVRRLDDSITVEMVLRAPTVEGHVSFRAPGPRYGADFWAWVAIGNTPSFGWQHFRLWWMYELESMAWGIT